MMVALTGEELIEAFHRSHGNGRFLHHLAVELGYETGFGGVPLAIDAG